MHSKVDKEYIRTAGLKGFPKSEVEVIVRSPSGQQRQVLIAELSKIRRDRRRRKRRDYVTVCSLSQEPRSDLTYNISTRCFSITFHMGYHHGYIKLDEEREAAFIAVLYLLLHRNKRLFLQLIGCHYNRLPMLSKYYIQRFKRHIKTARRAWFQSARAHRR